MDKINDFLANNPRGPLGLIVVLFVLFTLIEARRAIRWRAGSALGFAFAALVATQHFGFSQLDQCAISAGVFIGVFFALSPPPPRDRTESREGPLRRWRR